MADLSSLATESHRLLICQSQHLRSTSWFPQDVNFYGCPIRVVSWKGEGSIAATIHNDMVLCGNRWIIRVLDIHRHLTTCRNPRHRQDLVGHIIQGKSHNMAFGQKNEVTNVANVVGAAYQPCIDCLSIAGDEQKRIFAKRLFIWGVGKRDLAVTGRLAQFNGSLCWLAAQAEHDRSALRIDCAQGPDDRHILETR